MYSSTAASTCQHSSANPTRTHGTSHQRSQPTPSIRPLDDNTTATFLSTASTTLNSSNNHASRFAELEASIKSNHHDFKQLNKQHDTMEHRLLETMSTCHENTKQLLAVQGQLNNLQSTMHMIAEQMKLLTHHLVTTTPAKSSLETDRPQSSPVKKKARQDISSESFSHAIDNTPSTHHPGSHNPQLNTTSTTNSSKSFADQEDAQYSTQCSPGPAMPK